MCHLGSSNEMSERFPACPKIGYFKVVLFSQILFLNKRFQIYFLNFITYKKF